MLNGKVEFGERLRTSCQATAIQYERPPGARKFAILSVALLFALLYMSPADGAFADTPVTSTQIDTFSAEATETWVQDVLGRLGNSSGLATGTFIAPGEQFILAQTGEPKVCTSFRSGDAWKVPPPAGEPRSTCGPAFMRYRGTSAYGIICKKNRQGVDPRMLENAEIKLSTFQSECKCSNECKP
jgi:hypothetical protein